MEQILDVLAPLMGLSFLVKFIIDPLSEAMDTEFFNGRSKRFLYYVAIAIGVFTSVTSNINVLGEMISNPRIGEILTGLAIGRMASMNHDLLRNLFRV